MNVQQIAVVDFFDLISEVQCKLEPPVTQMYPSILTADEVETWFTRLVENYGAANGLYVPLWLGDSSWASPQDILIKQACRELTGETERVLLHYSW